jgi:hypothetical protein
MSIYAPKPDKTDKSKFLPTPEPTIFVCTAVIDLGLKASRNKPDDYKHKIGLLFEVAEKDEKGKHKTVYSEFTLSLYDQSALYKFLTAWLGKPVPEDYDLSRLLGVTGFGSLVQNGDFVNLQSPMPVPKGMSAFTDVNIYPEGTGPTWIKKGQPIRIEPVSTGDIPADEAPAEDDIPF